MKELLESIYGSQLVRYETRKASLPLYLGSKREFVDVAIYGAEFVLVNFLSMDRFNVSSLIKNVKQYQEKFSENIVYGFPSVTTFQRKSLIENNVAFVAGNGQVSIPFLGSYFAKCQNEIAVRPVDRLSPSSQLLLLFLIYNGQGRKFSKSEAAKALGISAMSVTRAARELVSLGLILEEKTGNETLIYREKSSEAMLSEALPYMINPVQEVIYVPENMAGAKLLKAGEYSLADRSMLGYPKHAQYAVFKNSRDMVNADTINPDLSIDEPYIEIQKWKYDPEILGHGGMVDPVSLICSFIGENDERINKCLGEVRKEIDRWRIKWN